MTHYDEIKRLIAHPNCLFLKTLKKFKNPDEKNKNPTMQNIRNFFKTTNENNNTTNSM